MKYYFTSIWIAKIKNMYTNNVNAGKDVKQLYLLHTD